MWVGFGKRDLALYKRNMKLVCNINCLRSECLRSLKLTVALYLFATALTTFLQNAKNWGSRKHYKSNWSISKNRTQPTTDLLKTSNSHYDSPPLVVTTSDTL